MALAQDGPYVLQGIALGGQQDEVVVHQIGGLAEEEVAVVVLGLDDELDGLLADFLGDLVDAAGQQLAGVTFVAGVVAAVLHGPFQVVQEVAVVGFVPAGVGAGVADRPGGARLHQQAVAVAVGPDADEFEVVTAGFALGPQALFAAAEEGDPAGGQGMLQGDAVHVTLHEDYAGAGVLHDGGQQPVGGLREG